MSAQSRHDRDKVLKYAPPWARESQPADDPDTAQPVERFRSAPQLASPVDYDEEPFEGDVAIKQLRHRRSLDPEPVPEPSLHEAPRPQLGMFVRFFVAAVIAAVVAFSVVAFMQVSHRSNEMLTEAEGMEGLWATLTGHAAASRGPKQAISRVSSPEVAAETSPRTDAGTDAVPVQPQAISPAATSRFDAVAPTPAVRPMTDAGTNISAPLPARPPQAMAPAATTHLAAVSSTPTVRGVTDSEIRFGMSAPFSGPARELGRQMKLGIETAFDRVNEAGGIDGRQLRIVAADDGYEPARTGETMKRLYDNDQVFGIIGNVGTPTAAVAVPFALDRKMLFFGAFTGANVLRRDPPDRYVFNYRASYAEETSAVVRYLVKVRGLRPDQIAVFAQQDSYGDAGVAGVAKAVRQLRGGDGSTLLRLNYQRNTVDVDQAVAQLREHKVIKAVVMVATYRAAAKFIEKTRPLYPALIYSNVSFVGSTALADELMLLGPRYAAGVIVTQVVPAVDGHSTTILEYKSALEKYFPGEAPDYVSLEGYVTANVLIEALKRVGPQVDTERLVDSLETLRDLDLGLGTPITFGRTEHQASHKVWGTQLDANGHYQEIELE
jgi:branched-chain amino acid transport system substrate-binding protein